MNDNESLAHTTWNCKYHIVIAPKYRRKIFYGEKRGEIGKILRELCGWKGVNIIEAEVCPDHIHMLLEIPLKIAVSSFMGFLKGKAVSLYTRDTQTWNTSMETDLFGVADIMWTPQEKTPKGSRNTSRIKRNTSRINLKKTGSRMN